MPMVLCVTLAMRALMEILLPEGDLVSAAAPGGWSRWHWVLYVALGFGFLAKGPIALLVPALALVFFRFIFWRKPVPWGRLYLLRGLLLALVIVGAWGVPALIETKGQFWKVGMGEHVIDRGTRALNGRIPFPGYYLGTALVSLFPWIAFLPQAWSAVRRRYNPVLALLVCWFFAPYVIFTFYATQLPHYVMPGVPAAMVLLVLPDQPCRKHTWWVVLVIGLWMSLAAVLWVGSQSFAWPEGLMSVVKSGAWVLTALAIFGSLMVGAVRFQSRKACLVALVTLCFVPLSVDALCASIRRVHAAALLSGDAKTLPDNTEWIACQFTEPSLVFHFDRTWRFTANSKTLDDRLHRRGPHYALMLRREWTMSDCFHRAVHRESFAAPATDFSTEVDALVAAHPDYASRSVSVFNAARASWAELVVLSRGQ